MRPIPARDQQATGTVSLALTIIDRCRRTWQCRSQMPSGPNRVFAAIRIAVAILGLAAWAGDPATSVALGRQPDISFRNEVQHAIDRGLEFLLTAQYTNGGWLVPDSPVVTALVLVALVGDPSHRHLTNAGPMSPVNRGFRFLEEQHGDDVETNLAPHAPSATALRTFAVLSAGRSVDRPALYATRHLLQRALNRWTALPCATAPATQGAADADSLQAPDIHDILAVLDALRSLDRVLEETPPAPRGYDLEAVLRLIQGCQQPRSSAAPQRQTGAEADRGGFVDARHRAQVAAAPDGAATCAGVLSYLSVGLQPQDERVQAACGWLRRHFTLDANPGHGREGNYRFLCLLARSSAALGIDRFALPDGRSVDWRQALAMRLLDLQEPDGSWIEGGPSATGTDSIHATAWAVIAMEIVYRDL
jgi:squalene-hopene/tetraprenyl-beta-curcumene cyclase